MIEKRENRVKKRRKNFFFCVFSLMLWYNVIVGIGVLISINGDNMSFLWGFYVFIKN